MGLDKYWTIMLVVCFIFIWHLEGSRKYPNGVFNLKYENKLKQKFSLKKKVTDFHSYMPKEKFPLQNRLR
jgi:hypothetical protein